MTSFHPREDPTLTTSHSPSQHPQEQALSSPHDHISPPTLQQAWNDHSREPQFTGVHSTDQ